MVYLFKENLFFVFKLILYYQVKVVILGQDLYYGVGQVYGLSFLVMLGVCILFLLLNIYKEFYVDLGLLILKYGYLVYWVE